jgi:hypothetical protein
VVTEIRIYYEGDALLRPGFNQFFDQLSSRARALRCAFHVIAGGSGPSACRDFGLALEAHPTALNILLKDSEGPLTAGLLESLCREQGWGKSHRDSIFWMVEMMESWFHADKEALEKFYGPDFKKNALKSNPKVEDIPKADLVTGLKKATKDTLKGNYFDNKTSHGPKLLAQIKPDTVRKAAPNCGKLFTAVLARLDEPGSRKKKTIQ